MDTIITQPPFIHAHEKSTLSSAFRNDLTTWGNVTESYTPTYARIRTHSRAICIQMLEQTYRKATQMSGTHYYNPDGWTDIPQPPSPLVTTSFLVSLLISSPSLDSTTYNN